MLPSRLLECTRQVTPPPLRPGQLEPFLSPTRAIFQPLWGTTRAETGEYLSISSPPTRGRCAAKRSLPPTLLVRSSGQEDAISRRGRLLQGTSRPNLVDGHLGSWLFARRENFVDMTHFVVLEGSRNGDQKQQQDECERRDVTIPVECSRRLHGTIPREKVQHLLATTTKRFRALVLGSPLRPSFPEEHRHFVANTLEEISSGRWS